MIWNSRGTSMKSFRSLIRDLKKHYHLDFLAIVETHATNKKASETIKNLGFSYFNFVDAEGFSGGIWCLWDKVFKSVKIISHHLTSLCI